MGWRFHRVWASAWFQDPDGQAELIERRWRDAVAAPVGHSAAQEPAPVVSEPAPAACGLPRPRVPQGLRIEQYTDSELDDIACWVLSDDLALAALDRVRDATAGGR